MSKTGPLVRDVSDTALWVAVYRARETERPDALFRDPYARRLAGARGEQIARAAAAEAPTQGTQILWVDGVKNAYPRWSKDGAWILFNSDRDGGTLQLYDVHPDGTGLHRLAVSEDEETCARVSPQGDRILLLANLKGGRDDALLRRRDGSNPVNLTRDAAPDGWPTWTPDGRRIVFASRRGSLFALYSMKPDGSDVRQLTFPEKPFFDARPSVSPDGRRIVFNRQKDETIGIYVVDLAPASR